MQVLLKLAKLFLVPPANLYIIGLIGWLLLRSRPNLGRALIALSGVLLIALSTPIVSRPLFDSLKQYPALDMSRADGVAGAIVDIGADTRLASEYGGEIPGPQSQARLRYAARLHKHFPLPVLVTGGYAENNGPIPVAELMAKDLEEDFGIAARWQETKSRNAYESTRLTAEILRQNDIKTVYLVTDAASMSRTKTDFERLDIAVIPAPMNGSPAKYDLSYRDFLPNPHSMYISAEGIYEYLQRLREYIGQR